jgi:hypothetical protein
MSKPEQRLIIADSVELWGQGVEGKYWYRVATSSVPMHPNENACIFVLAAVEPPTGFIMVIPDPRVGFPYQYDLVEDWLPDE